MGELIDDISNFIAEHSWSHKDRRKFVKRLRLPSVHLYALMTNHVPNKFELRMYSILDSENIEYEQQYELDGKYFDAYLPQYNTLLEFDGYFFHKQSLDECEYRFQKDNYWNDRLKDEIAKAHGLKLIRIKEESRITSIKDLL